MAAILFILISAFILVNSQRQGEPCLDAYNVAGTCSLLSQCRTAINLQRFGIEPKYCKRDTIVCCTDDSPVPQASIPLPSMKGERPVWGAADDIKKGKKRISEKKCDEYSKSVVEVFNHISLLPNPESHAISSSKCNYEGVGLIVGGEDAKQGEFPHMAAIGWDSPGGKYSFDCGGTLISSRFVLTAGHCTKAARGAEPVVVRLGDQNINPAVRDSANPIDVPIKKIHVHPDYSSPVVYNDIALLELVNDVKFNDDIRPACLWTKKDFPGYTKVVATGWGIVDIESRNRSDELKKVTILLLNNNYCDKLLDERKNRNWQNGFISSQICAGELEGGKDTCGGDSGGPIQVSSYDNRCIFYIAGVTSFGNSCAIRGLPGIYTRVSSFVDWIENIVWPNE